jgi:hypothetical protein
MYFFKRFGFPTSFLYIHGVKVIIKVMMQNEFQQQVNNRFYSFIESNFPEYQINDERGDVMYFRPEGQKDSIEYNQLKHELNCLNWSNEKIKNDLEQMEQYLNMVIIPNVNRLKMDLAF